MNFRELNDAQLAELPDEKLVEYIVGARRAGRLEEAVKAAEILAFTYQERILAYVGVRVRNRGEVVVNEVTETILTDAIVSAGKFEGSSIGEFRGWIFRIASNKINDYLRGVYRRKDKAEEVPVERKGEDGGEREYTEGDPFDAVDDLNELTGVFNEAYGELNHVHQEVIKLLHFRDLPHKEIAVEISRQFGDELNDPMTEQNVNQINSRFRKRLRELLADAEDPQGPDDDD